MTARTREQQDEYNRKRREANAAKLAAASKPKELPSKPKRVAPPKKPTRKKADPPKATARRVSAAKVTHAPPVALAKDAPVIQSGAPRMHTMARSYVRTSGAGQGKERNGTYQCTVSFTSAQIVQLREAASFRCVSLAEMIRSCCVEHLNKKLT